MITPALRALLREDIFWPSFQRKREFGGPKICMKSEIGSPINVGLAALILKLTKRELYPSNSTHSMSNFWIPHAVYISISAYKSLSNIL